MINMPDSKPAISRTYLLLLWIVLFLFLCLTAYGLIVSGGYRQIPWTSDGIKRFFLFSSVTLGVLWLVAFSIPQYLHRVAIIIAGLFCVGSMGAAPLLTVVWIGLSSYLTGKLFMQKVMCQTASEALDIPLQLVFGLGVYATIISIAAPFKVNYPIVYSVLLTAPLLLSRATITDWMRTVPETFKLQGGPDHPYLSCFAWYLAFIFLVTAAMPEVGYDALAMHLMIPGYVAHNHMWSFDFMRYVWAVMPMNGDWLFSLAYMFAGEYGARLLNLGLLAVIVWLLSCFVGQFSPRRYVLIAAILLLSLPLTYLETGSLFVENAWCCFLLGAFLVIVRYEETGSSKMLILCGALTGFALAAKLTTVLMLPWFAVVLVWRMFRTRTGEWPIKAVLTAMAVFVFVGFIPYAIAFLKTGNPVFPFYNAIFKSPFYDTTTNFNTGKLFREGVSLRTLYDLTFATDKYLESTVGGAGFWFLALLPVSLLIGIFTRIKAVRFSVLTGLGFILLVFSSTSYIRYVFPAVPLLIAFQVAALHRSESISPWLSRALHVALLILVSLNLLFFMSANWSYRDFPVQIVLDNAKRGRYILERAPLRRVVEYVNALPGASGPMALFAQPVFAGFHGEILTTCWYNWKFSGAVNKSDTPAALASILNEYDSSLIIVDDNMKDEKLMSQLGEISTILEKFGYVSVRRLRGEYNVPTEKMKNPNFESRDGWNFTAGAEYREKSRTVLVSADSPLNQVVTIKPGRRYTIEVSARCASGGEFRLQANWLDDKNKFIRTDFDVVKCSDDFITKTKEVVAPDNARSGVIYGTSHNNSPVEVRRVSFK